MNFLQSAILFLTLGTLHIITGFNFYNFEPNCVAPCNELSVPLFPGDPPCFCTPDNSPQGCQIAPCGPGEDASETYTCQCTEYFQPYQCVTLLCDNGTNSHGNNCPSSSSSSSSYYPTQSYSPTQSYYPSQSYPTPSYYPSQSYPAPSYGPSYYPVPSYQSPQYGYPQSSYSSYPSNNLCNKYCVCEPYLPADCTVDSIPPIIGGPPCACNEEHWRTGCTIKPCQETDTGDDSYVCECTPENSPDFCRTPRCSRS